MRVASVQFAPVFMDKTANLKRMAILLEQAVRNGAHLVVFPELATTGYSLMGEPQAASVAEVIDESGNTFRIMSSLAKLYKVGIAWGMVEKDIGSGELYNSQVLVAHNGQDAIPVVEWTSYRKVNRWGQDFIWASAGRSNPSILNVGVARESHKIGLLICRDVRDKKDDKWKSFYEKGDADIVCMSSNWGDGGFPAVSWMDFATENKTTLIVSNRYGREANNNFGEGGICIISPDGKVNCEGLVWDQDCIVYGEV
jgi:N-carbamoylputrescine amidase